MIDPNIILDEARDAVDHLCDGEGDLHAYKDRLLNAFIKLDEYLSHGGNPPEDWLPPFKSWMGKCPQEK